jgi:hypothetical protein
MSAPSYDVVTIDLTAANTDARFAANFPIEAITVLQVDDVCTIKLGNGKPAIPIVAAMQIFQMCPALDEGFYITNAVGAGSLILMLSFGGVTVSQAA